MKNVFAFDTATERADGEEFVVRRIDGELARKQEKLSNEVNVHQKNASLPLWLLLVMYIGGGFGILCLVEFLVAPLGDDGTPYAEAYARAPWVVWVGGALTLLAVALFIIATVRKKRVEGSVAYSQTVAEAEQFVKESRAALGIPADAIACDVFLEAYKITKSGKRKPAMGPLGYYNSEWLLFREGDDLCFGDSSVVYKIPRERIGRFVRVNKRAAFYGWNKPVPCHKGEFKQYKIRRNNNDSLFVKPYLSLQIIGSEEYEILFPPYEHATITQLTGRFPE